MDPMFVVSPLYVAVGIVIAVLVVQEYLRYGVPQRHTVRRHSQHPHHQHKSPFHHGAD